MAKKSRNFNWESGLNKFLSEVWKLLDQLEVDNPTNAVRKVSAQQRTIAEQEALLNEYLELTNTTKHGNAKQRILSLMKKVKDENIAEKYNLDCSFLFRNSKAWTVTIGGQENVEKAIIAFEKKAVTHREMCQNTYFFCLSVAEKVAKEAGFTDEEVAECVQAWHEEMKEQYDLLSASDFWLKFRGDFIGVNIERKDKPAVALTEAIRMVQEYTHQTIYLDLISAGSSLGTVPRSQFDRWDSRFKSFEQMHVKEGVPLLKEFAAQITSYAVHRMVHGSQSWPTPDEEAKLFSILAPPEVNPYTAEFMVDDNSKLNEVMAYYYQLSGTNLPS